MQVECGLEEGWAIDRIGGGSGGGEGSLGFGKVSNAAVDAGFEEVDLGEDHFVVEAFEFCEEGVDEGEGGAVLLGVDVTAKGEGRWG